jgi:penicillin-binding protein 1C
MKRRGKIIAGLGVLVAVLAAGAYGLDALDRAFPPPLANATSASVEVKDAEGRLLRAFATPDGRWRLTTKAEDVDPQFLRMLVAYEDQRFYDHHGIDPIALSRAALQLLTSGRIVSGASTLSMQVARLIEPRTDRSLRAKFLQMARALQIERRLDKAEILDLYLNIAPYGGNLEGVRAAGLAWFGKEPRRLDTAEAALLVALPQLPERRRPDRFPEAAKQARERVLQRLAVSRVVGEGEAERAALSTVPSRRIDLPAYAPHLAQVARAKLPQSREINTTLRLPVQREMEALAKRAAEKLGPRVSVAIVMADSRTGEIIAEVGSPDYLDTARRGWVDMSQAIRSPGSTLKPFIYGLAFENGLVAQETIIEDRPADFFGYRPRNFDMQYQGDVSVRQALQLANRGTPVRLGDGVRAMPSVVDGDPLLSDVATWNVTDTLSAVLPPLGMTQRGIAYKTGTSYGYRDAWSVGYDGRHVIGVWAGRADNGAVPGLTGYASAAPILFEAFAKSGVAITPFSPPPAGASRLAQSQLPANQKRFTVTASGLLSSSHREAAPQIVYPPEGARVELSGQGDGNLSPLVLKLQGGRARSGWLPTATPLPETSRRRSSQWLPEGEGFSTLTVIDADGRASSVRIFVD